ncbi:MAG: hypothetical protein AAF655_03940 [Bacteroidota bacterium]
MKPAKVYAENDLQKQFPSIEEYVSKMDEIHPFLYRTELSLHLVIKHVEEKITPANKEIYAPFVHTLNEMELRIQQHQDELDGCEKVAEFIGPLASMLVSDDEYAIFANPFGRKFVYVTEKVQDTFANPDLRPRIDPDSYEFDKKCFHLKAGALILNRLYNIDYEMIEEQAYILYDIKNDIDNYFKMFERYDFIDVIPLKPLKPLSEEDLDNLLKNPQDEEIWLSYFPPEDFLFRGLGIGYMYDVSRYYIANEINLELQTNKRENPKTMLEYMGQKLKSFFKRPDLETGFLNIIFSDFISDGNELTLTKIQNYDLLARIDDDRAKYGGIYHEAYEGKRGVVMEDLTKLKSPSIGEKLLIEKGVKSVILFPVCSDEGEVLSILEIATREANVLHVPDLLKLENILQLVQRRINRNVQDLDGQINNYIQKEFTAIHSSVKWRFEEIALKEQLSIRLNANLENASAPEAIVFKDLYPLYAQADIVSSSTLRNKAIQEDLVENLEAIEVLLDTWNHEMEFPLMDALLTKTRDQISLIRERFSSSEESSIISYISSQIHPFIKQMKESYPFLSKEPYDIYKELIDPELGIIYRKRRAYENSVNQLNAALSATMDKEQEKLQKILPHYFEKYNTDGIEYNMYLGQSILQRGDFTDYHLQSFRIWQLTNMVEITRQVECLKSKLEVPLSTAQLVLIYNSELSIRFRVDEKQFDVDGSYNVRYEIIKKRIDKSIIKGTGERLTVAGKIAIVYLQEEDKQEYMRYLEYMVSKGLVEPEIEDLELDRLQGAEGLHALRVTVKIPSKENQSC